MRRHRFALSVTKITHARATVNRSITIEPLVPAAGHRDTHAILLAHHRSEIADHQDRPLAPLFPAQKSEHAIGGIAAVDPFEAARRAVAFAQSWALTVKAGTL